MWLLLPFAILGVGGYVWAHSQAEAAATKKAEWQSIEGTIVAHGSKAVSTKQPELRETWIRYVVNGQSYRMTEELQWDTPLKSSVEVWYHPDHPADGRQYAPSSLWEHGGPWIFVSFVLLLWFLLVQYMIKALDVFYEPVKKPPTPISLTTA